MIRRIGSLPIATKLWLLVSAFFITALIDTVSEISLDAQRLHREKEVQLKQLVETAHSVLAGYEAAARSGTITTTAAQQRAVQSIRNLRYSAREYFWIHDLGTPIPSMVMHPTVPQLDGKRLDDAQFNRARASRQGVTGDYAAPANANLFVAMNHAVADSGEGYVEYDWPKPKAEGGVSEKLYPKLSYVRAFAPWGWVIGTGIYIDDLDAQFWRDVQLRVLRAGAWLLLLGLMAWGIARTIIQPLRNFQGNINALRQNPDSPVQLPANQPAELSGLTKSFQGLMTDLRHSRAALQTSMEKLKLAGRAFSNMSEGVVITDADVRILSVNPAFTRINGYEESEVIGRNPSLLRSNRHDEHFYLAMWEEIGKSGTWSGEIWNQAKDGRIYPEWLSISASFDSQGKVRNYVGVFSDITERKDAETRIRYLAEHDALTGLPNRSLLLDRLDQAILKAQRNSAMVAVVLIDLDHFKHINDTLGHTAGDTLLQELATRFRSAMRASDTLCRSGGDEFIIMLPDLHDASDAARVTESVLGRLNEPLPIADTEVIVSASVGISVFPNDGDSSQRLIQCADMAMYHSKEAGRNTYHYFTEDMNARVFERMSLEHRLRQGLDRGEFLLHYQPQVSTVSGAICGVEALARWAHHDMGMISPARFIPVAEDSGLILRLGQWVLREACRQAKAWESAGLPRLTIAVNISAIQFREPTFIETVRSVLEETGLSPDQLELELTESIVMNRVEQTVARLQELKDSGVRLSIDDFGTGYSSLAYLKRFPLDKLKIDQSFVRGVVDDPQDAAIVRTIITLADSLKLTTIAEGVESAGTCCALRLLGCKEIQGYFYSRPLPAAEIETLIRQWRCDTAMQCHAQQNIPPSG